MHTTTITATSYSTSISLSESFSITVADPCLTTTLAFSVATLNFSTMLGKLDNTGAAFKSSQQITVTDAVSISSSVSSACGIISLTISESPASGVAALKSGQLTISSSQLATGVTSGLIEVWTDVVMTVGFHTVTL